MSLLDAFLRDALLQNIVQSDVYIAIRTDNPVNSTPIGSGTATDPYGGPADSGDWFDSVMANVGTNRTVRIGPGVFATRGSAGNTTGAYAVRSGMRIIGSGMGVTQIKLTGIPNNSTRYAVGMDFSPGGTGLDGFEMSDLEVNCNLTSNSATGAAAAALRVRGSNIYIHRIKVTDYGTRANSSSASIVTAAGDYSSNCVLQECVCESPSTAHQSSSTLRLFAFETASNSHQFCVIRDCAARGNATFEPPPSIAGNLIGIWPGAGTGTIIEGNQLANLRYGLASTGVPVKDLIIRNNFFRNVFKGVLLDQQSGTPADRVILHDNIVELSREIDFPIGFEFTAAGANRFVDLIARKNIVRQVTDTRPLLGNASGLSFRYCTRAILENNVINDTVDNSAVYYQSCDSVKFFNNQNTAGRLLRGYNQVTSKFILELEDAVQDVLLPL